MAAAVSSARSGGIRGSESPARTRGGTHIAARLGLLSTRLPPPYIVQITRTPRSIPSVDSCREEQIVSMCSMQDRRHNLSQHCLEVYLGLRDQSPPLHALVGGVWTSRGIQQCQFDHAFGCLPHDFKTDVPPSKC